MVGQNNTTCTSHLYGTSRLGMSSGLNADMLKRAREHLLAKHMEPDYPKYIFSTEQFVAEYGLYTAKRQLYVGQCAIAGDDVELPDNANNRIYREKIANENKNK